MDAIAQALQARPQLIEDQAFGPGFRFAVGASQEPNLDLYPASGVLRFSAGDVELTLYRAAPPIIAQQQIVFEREEHEGLRHLALTRKGEITLLLVPLPQTRAPAEVGPTERRTPS
jgi:hypothetical protein